MGGSERPFQEQVELLGSPVSHCFGVLAVGRCLGAREALGVVPDGSAKSVFTLPYHSCILFNRHYSSVRKTL